MQFQRVGHVTERFLGVRGPNFTKLGGDIGRSLLQNMFISAIGYLAAFSNAGGSNLSDVENDAIIRYFDPPPVKIREAWARSLDQLLKLYYDRTSGIHLMAIHCAAAERGVLLKR